MQKCLILQNRCSELLKHRAKLFVVLTIKMYKIMLTDDYNYFLTHREELYKTYPDRYLVISKQAIRYDGTTFDEALEYGNQNFGVGNFLVQKCTEKEEIQKFYSRVAFA